MDSINSLIYLFYTESMNAAETIDNGDDPAENNNTEFNDGEREKLIQQLMQLLSSGDSEECSICLEILQDPVITKYIFLLSYLSLYDFQ